MTYADARVSGIDDLHRLLSEGEPGAEAPITLVRGGEKLSVEIAPTWEE